MSSIRSIDIVAQDDRDFEAGRKAQHFARAGDGIHAAGIGDHFDIALADAPGDAGDERRKVARVAEVRIGLLLLLQDRHGDFGEVVEDRGSRSGRLRQGEQALRASRPRSPGRWRCGSFELTITLDIFMFEPPILRSL